MLRGEISPAPCIWAKSAFLEAPLTPYKKQASVDVLPMRVS
jgi:hypothetical protein